jgi:hypothetical protein
LVSQLQGISCANASACISVGWWSDPSANVHPLAEALYGSVWRRQKPPLPQGGLSGQLDGIACTEAASCTAAGYFDETFSVETLVERY